MQCHVCMSLAQGTLFCDYGTDLNSGMSVTGDPAGARGKPGSGFGYGEQTCCTPSSCNIPLCAYLLKLGWYARGGRKGT